MTAPFSWSDASAEDVKRHLSITPVMDAKLFYAIVQRDDGLELLSQYQGKHTVVSQESIDIVIEKTKTSNADDLVAVLLQSRPQALARLLGQEIMKPQHPHLLPLFASVADRAPTMACELTINAALHQKMDVVEALVTKMSRKTVTMAEKKLNGKDPYIIMDYLNINRQTAEKGMELTAQLFKARIQQLAITKSVTTTANKSKPSKM